MATVYLLKIKSETSPREYEIRLGKDGVVYCTCMSCRMSFSRGKPDCKHLRKAMANPVVFALRTENFKGGTV